jgi:CheY-like chemotaxis protein
MDRESGERGVVQNRSGAKLLVVEDDIALQQIVSSLFEQRGLAVTAVPDGASAIDVLDRESFDLVLLDLGLPGVGGLDVLAHIQEKESRPKVIVMTGDTTSGTVLESVRAQAYHYLVKPIQAETLVEVVEDALAAPAPMPITLVSGKSDWVELLVPCEANAPERVQSFDRMGRGTGPDADRPYLVPAGEAYADVPDRRPGRWLPSRGAKPRGRPQSSRRAVSSRRRA